MPALLDQDLLVINQEATLVELADEYHICDEDGNHIGVIRREGRSRTVHDADGRRVLTLRYSSAFLKSWIDVTDADDRDVGRIVQPHGPGKVRLVLEDASGECLGEIRGRRRRTWDFAVLDASGAEVGRITKKWAGLGHELFTTVDNYVLEIGVGIGGALRLLVLASVASCAGGTMGGAH